MWPTEGYPGMPSGWAATPRRARVAALVAVGALALATAAATWLSVRPGAGSAPVYGDPGPAGSAVWTWDGSAYAVTAVAAGGPGSNHADMAFDRARGVVVLWDHGCARLVMGFTGGCAERVDRTWTWDGAGWSPRATSSTPAEAGPGAMVYDGRLGRVVYVSGAGRAWSWSGSDWAPVAMPGGPAVPGRGSAAVASMFAAGYDEGRGRLVLALSTATWSWDGVSWTETRSGIDAADARADANLVYDRAHGQLVYVGERHTWTWDGVRWRPHEQPAIAGAALAYDAARATVMAVQQDARSCDRVACRTATWAWDSTGWTRLAIERGPLLPLTRSGAFPPPAAFDEVRGVLVLFASAV